MKFVRVVIFFAIILVVLVSNVPAFAAKDGGQGSQFAQDRILVQFQPNTSSESEQAVHARHGGAIIREIPELNLQVVKVPPGQAAEKVKEYKAENSVADAEPDYLAQACFSPNDPYFVQTFQWNLTRISAPQAWDITTGSANIKVAILDSGIDTSHPDLQGKVIASVNYTDSSTTNDVYSHGTHIAGIVAASTNNSIGVAGLGYNTSLLNVKVINDIGYVYNSDIISGIVWAAENGANVISMSFGQTTDNPEMETAVNYAWNKGVVLVGPSGNNGNSVPFYPAAYDNVIAVAATTTSDTLKPDSDYGDWVDVGAPGDSVWSTLAGSKYGYKAGTSVASPHVAGLAALVFTRVTDTNGDGLLNDEVRAAIENNCDNIGVTGIGHGRINAYKAVSTSTPVTTGAISGTVTDTATGAAISGATVNAGSYSTTTGITGSYTITNIPAGTYTVTASKSGYTSQSFSNKVVNAGSTITINFTLTTAGSTGTINGTVKDAATSKAISGATVTAGSYSDITDNTGVYEISVPAGTYNVTASANGYSTASVSRTVSAGSTTTANFLLNAVVTTGTLSGTVKDAATSKVVSGATVAAGGYSDTTDSTGAYTISVPAGTYLVTASANGYSSASTAAVVNAGMTTTVNFLLNRIISTGTINGTVATSTGMAISGATVTAGDYSDITDSMGSYSIPGLPDGSYTVTASAGGYTPQTKSATVIGGNTVRVNFTLTAAVSTGAISGTVSSSTGVPISGATVTTGSYSDTTDSSGSYSISSVPAGTYTVSASAAGYTGKSSSATVTAGETTTVNFLLNANNPDPLNMWVENISTTFAKSSLKIMVSVNSDTGVVSGAQVTVLVSCSDGSQWNLQGATGRKGTVTFNIAKPPSGDYIVEITDLSASGYVWNSALSMLTKNCSK